ncbi:MAG: hypothetical protein Q8M43_04925 [Sulfuricurvum sp.]|uniref:hypothetical protein n=1 Tax=Sulfuricurvum sp. TaxID=2025608 RepID=UPI0027338D16|nr:hypothetical protein [Sulfuricurvum sp.]MDP2849820.1 hypothetical protein [Sulfuricurvum sp.]MDP3291358.1 hypothetical protein [Sulfuricurvum sp.]
MSQVSLLVTATASLLILSGCANREGVAPSQNSSLHSISPSTTAASEGGAMQHSLDSWLKEEWTPMTKIVPVETKTTAPDGTVVTTTTMVEVPETDSNESFTLQKYADKWKVYHESKAKMMEGKPKAPSHIEMMGTLPVVGK